GNVEVENFLKSRFSCRRFIPRPIDNNLLSRIMDIAQRTPSQCNRQSGRIHYYSNRKDIDTLLKLQGGAEGFRESVYNLFIISSEISAWSGFKARNQAYVDGALLAMQVLNACQSLGLGACPLNLALSNKTELDICSAGKISKGERLIVMIAFGFPEPVSLVVARSERMPIQNLLIQH
ncbi:MAG: nitroreductase family protein, partial [Gammaproteobacteria bacterium]